VKVELHVASMSVGEINTTYWRADSNWET